jgi:hypothetical protein
MAKGKSSSKGLQSSSHLQSVLAAGADNVSILRGFLGPSDRDGYVRLFPSLADTSVSIDIPEDDIVETGDVKDNHLGKRIVWVKKGTRITVTKTRTTEYGVRSRLATDNEDVRHMRSAGRLHMQVTSAAARDVCACSCDCSTCQCHCTNWCGVCTCPPPLMRTTEE